MVRRRRTSYVGRTRLKTMPLAMMIMKKEMLGPSNLHSYGAPLSQSRGLSSRGSSATITRAKGGCYGLSDFTITCTSQTHNAAQYLHKMFFKVKISVSCSVMNRIHDNKKKQNKKKTEQQKKWKATIFSFLNSPPGKRLGYYL